MSEDRDITSEAGSGGIGRRRFLEHSAFGLASIALSAMDAPARLLAPQDRRRLHTDMLPRPSHFAPRARRVLQIFCTGALSHIDTFDYKPELIRRSGQPMPGADKLITFQGENGNLTRSPWRFRPRGECGKITSDLLPHLGSLVDEMCFIHSMTARSATHGPGENQMSTGFTREGYPSLGAWVSYALGSETQDLPGFVAIPDPRGVPQSSVNNWAPGFLPAVFQGTPFTADRPIPNLATPPGVTPESDRASRELLQFLNRRHLENFPGETELDARIASYELAARMQLRAAEVGSLSTESASTRREYCVDDSNQVKAAFGRNCLLARRLLERGVRFVQLFNGAYAMGEGVGNWDGHQHLEKQYPVHANIVDEPVAALLKDLRRRGLLDDTLVVFTTEFGRMPTFQKGAGGRDHNPDGFTVWLAGAGVRRGHSFGATDEFGHKAVEDAATIYDLHATILHLLGLDHERLTFYHDGIERRLTDVHGRVLDGVLA